MAQFSNDLLPAMPRDMKKIGTDPGYWLQKESAPSPATPGYADLDQPITDIPNAGPDTCCYYCGGPAVDEDDVGPICAGHVATLMDLLP